MSQTPLINAKKAVERHLATMLPSIQIAYEGVSFAPPANEMYLATQIVINQPDDPTVGDFYYRERLTFQVFVCDVLNKGTAAALAKAEAIRTRFDKGLTLIENSTRIHVTRTPQISGTVITNDRLVVPVLIELWAEVYK